MKYTLYNGMLPDGVEITDNTIYGFVAGTTQFDELTAPIWVSESSLLGDFDEGETVELAAVEAVGQGDTTIDRYSIVGTNRGYYKSLPWGLTINPETGIISGTIQEISDPFATPFVASEIPVWVTEPSLGNYGEEETVSIHLDATPQLGSEITLWNVVKGGLPWGLKLDSTSGLISGVTSRVKATEATLTFDNKPLWNTMFGSLGSFNENEAVSIQLDCSALNDKTMVNWNIVKGGLPWGVKLNSSTGLLSGTASEVKLSTDPIFYVDNGPTFTENKKLGNFVLGDAIDVTITATPALGRTIMSYIIDNKDNDMCLPWGLKLNPVSGKLSGTISTETKVGTYEFNIMAIDSAKAISVATFNIVITEE